jgi:membrane-associated protein
MDVLWQVWDFIVHINLHLTELVRDYGAWTYGILFLIVFAETGLVVTPFLPGDSLLFAAGAICASDPPPLSVWGLGVVLFVAAVLGDTVNYHIGKFIGPPAFSGRFRFLKRDHLTRTQQFFEKYGAKAIVLARFVPIVRTFAPFVAGVGTMHYPTFLFYNVFGAALWVGIFLGGGYLIGQHEFVQKNFHVVTVLIILISVIPIIIEWWKARRAAQRETTR